LLQKKPALTLAHLAARGRSYTSVLAKDVDTTFAHSNHIFSMLQKQGLVKIIKKPEDKRIKYAVLTGEGLYVAERIIEFLVFAEHLAQNQKDPSVPSQFVSKRINGILRQLKDIEDKNKTDVSYLVGPLRWNIIKLKETQQGITKKLIEEIDERIVNHLQHSRTVRQEDLAGKK
jgi:DNA-binding MarR family transcriptional regulator